MPEPEFNQLRQTVFAAARQDYLSGIQRIDEILQQQSKLQLTLEQQIRLLYSKAEYTYRRSETNAAITILALAKERSLASTDPSILYSYHNILASIFANLGVYQPALQHYRQALEKARFLPDSYYARQTENNLALILTKQRQFAEARRYFEHFYQHGIQTNDPSIQGVALNNLGEVALDEGNIKLARDLHQQALALRQQHQLQHHYSWSFLNLAKVAKAEQQWPTVIELARNSLQLREGKLDLDLLEPGLLLAEALAKTGQLAQAQQQLTQSLAIASQRQHAEWLLRGWQMQAELYRQQQPELALQAMQQALTAQQKLAEQRYALSIAQSAAELGLVSREAELQQSQRQHELAQLAATAQQQKLWLGIAAAVLILCMTLFFVLKIRRQNRALQQSLDHLQSTRRQLVEAEKMAALTSLVSGMAHQLNTPLGIILTAVSGCHEHIKRLQQKFDAKTLSATDLQQGLQENHDMLQLAERSTIRAAELVQRFKQISAQFEQAEPEPITLQQHLPDLMHSLLQSFNPVRPVKLLLDGPELTWIGYPAQLNKVLTALTENALYHGLPDIEQPQISLSWQLQQAETPTGPEAQQLLLQFADNGHGIPPELAAKVFDPFFSTKLGQGSLGLGLNIVFNTLQNLHGHIKLAPTTAAQPGCTFVLTLPLDIRHSRKPKSAAALVG
ncbi:sensor histidine kinase [Rheinheimera riviphila]|uniref:histidine kinase n=1 Tax=Rheinheimera riviphila TaxID=1834037 RepID=A0A437R5C5_9GAMM|nr:tetratricopeptide repeat-containing sensor histidine kinase [Rheinheimera riviphila]RVU41988.1 sensor histidine kinase [Rheinheimera riviphila]